MTAQAVTVKSTVVTQTAKIVRGTLTMSSSYATNGEAVAASALGLQHVDQFFLVPRGVTPFATQTELKWDPVNRKIVALQAGFPVTRKGAVAGAAAGAGVLRTVQVPGHTGSGPRYRKQSKPFSVLK